LIITSPKVNFITELIGLKFIVHLFEKWFMKYLKSSIHHPLELNL